MVAARPFQHAFGRSTQTKILDAVWNQRDAGINIRDLSRRIRQSYVYTTLAVKGLSDRGLITKERRGVEMVLRPRLSHPVMRWIRSL